MDKNACSDGYLFDIEGLRSSGGGQLIDDLYEAGRNDVRKIWHEASKDRANDMDAALIWALLFDNGATPDISVYDPESYEALRVIWQDKSRLPHVRAARLYLSSFRYRTGIDDAPNAYRLVYFLGMLANDQVKPLVDEYLDIIKEYMAPESMVRWAADFPEDERHIRTYHAVDYEITQGMFIAFCNGLIEYSDYERSVMSLVEKAKRD